MLHGGGVHKCLPLLALLWTKQWRPYSRWAPESHTGTLGTSLHDWINQAMSAFLRQTARKAAWLGGVNYCQGRPGGEGGRRLQRRYSYPGRTMHIEAVRCVGERKKFRRLLLWSCPPTCGYPVQEVPGRRRPGQTNCRAGGREMNLP